MIITLAHCRQSKICLRGVQAFCKRYDIDFKRLANEGIPEEEILATGNAIAERVVREAHGQEE